MRDNKNINDGKDETENGKSIHSITDAEWKVMHILWKNGAKDKNGKMTFGEIQESLKTEVSWNVNTIRTLLLRLAEKNIVGMEKTGKNYEYYAAAQEEDCAIQETKSLLERVFGGSTSLLFSTLIKNGGISPEEQEEILKVIESMKAGGDKK